MKATFALFSALAALTVTACKTTSMRTEAHPTAGVNFAAYQTYEWAPLDRAAQASFTDQDQKVRAAFVDEVDRIMKRRGFTKAGQGQGDLVVYAKGARMPGHRTVGGGAGVAYAPYYEPGQDGSLWLNDATYVSGGSGYLKEETQSAIRFLISEPKTDKVVWRGKSFVTVDNTRNDIMVQDDARRLARELLSGFPPKN